MTPGRVWAGLVTLSLTLHLRAVYVGPAWQAYVFKPLTTVLIVALALVNGRRTRGDCQARRYAMLIASGLGWSLVGDVCLLLPAGGFVAGLAAFLVAHLCYAAGFMAASGLRMTWRLAAPFAICLAVLLAVLVPRAGTLALPVVGYGVALVAMAWQAAERWRVVRSRAAGAAAVGGILFVISDSALAIDRFVAPFHAAAFVVMTTYILAQWLIAHSITSQRHA